MSDEADKAREDALRFRRVQRVEVEDMPEGRHDELVSRQLHIVTSTGTFTLVTLEAEEGSEFDAEVRASLAREASTFPCCDEMASAQKAERITHHGGQWEADDPIYGSTALYAMRFCPWCGAKLPESADGTV